MYQYPRTCSVRSYLEFSIYHPTFSGYIDIDIDNLYMWYHIDIMRYMSGRLSEGITCVFLRVGIQAWNKRISIQTDRRKRLAACALRIIRVGWVNAQKLDARACQGRKFNSDFFFFLAMKTKARSIIDNGEGPRVRSIWTRLWVTKGR